MRSVRILPLALVLAAALAVPAGAGPTIVQAKVAKQESGPYSDGLTANLGAGKAKNFYLKAKNTSTEQEELTLEQVFFDLDPRYVEKYFRNDNNITSAVQSDDGHAFGLKPGKAKVFRIKVKVTGGPPPDPFCVVNQVLVTSPMSDSDNANIGLNADCE